MKKYSKQMIIDYVNGNDIDGISSDELEKDVNFMKDVIEFTGDKNMCIFCDQAVLNNYEFVKYIVLKFKDDIPFVTSIADNFLDNKGSIERDAEVIELNIIMENIVDTKNDEKLSKYSLKNHVYYSTMLVEIEMGKIEANLDNDKEFGMGFLVIENMYPLSKEIKDYYASKFVDEIFYNNVLPFDDMIHKLALEKSTIKRDSVNSFINRVLKEYDVNLAWYVLINNDLLEKIRRDINKVYNGWEKKEYQQNTSYIILFENLVERFFEEKEPYTPSYTFTQLERYIVDKHNLKDIYLNSDFKNDYNEFLMNSDVIENLDRLSLIEEKYIKKASELAERIFIKKERIDEDEYFFHEREDVYPEGKSIKIMQFKKNINDTL